MFDLSRKYALHLSYWTDGDTRRRGEVLARFKQRYRASGFLGNLHGELPDYLPVVLEYRRHRRPPRRRGAVAGVPAEPRAAPAGACSSAPPRTPGCCPGRLRHVAGRLAGGPREVLARAQAGPPTESVGLDAYDPRLLPCCGGR